MKDNSTCLSFLSHNILPFNTSVLTNWNYCSFLVDKRSLFSASDSFISQISSFWHSPCLYVMMSDWNWVTQYSNMLIETFLLYTWDIVHFDKTFSLTFILSIFLSEKLGVLQFDMLIFLIKSGDFLWDITNM